MRRIGFLESNLSGSGFEALRIAKEELGLHVTFITRDLDRYINVPGAKRYFDYYVDDIYFCETNDYRDVERVLRKMATPFDALMTLGEYDVVVASRIARLLGVIGLNPKAAETARNKFFTRQACKEAGIPMPVFRGAQSVDELDECVKTVGLPCIIKPTDETSSANVFRCFSLDEAIEACHSIRGRNTNTRHQQCFDQVLVEECLVGYEVSIETFTWANNTQAFGVTDKHLIVNNHFVEIGHTFPSCLPKYITDPCVAVAVQALEAIGFDIGVAHIELKITRDGPKLIEINARPAGGHITDLVSLTTGVSPERQAIELALGNKPTSVPTPSSGAAIHYLHGKCGVVREIQGVKAALNVPGVKEVKLLVENGQRTRDPIRNGDRLAYAMAIAEHPYEASRLAECAIQQISVQYEPISQSEQFEISIT